MGGPKCARSLETVPSSRSSPRPKPAEPGTPTASDNEVSVLVVGAEPREEMFFSNLGRPGLSVHFAADAAHATALLSAVPCVAGLVDLSGGADGHRGSFASCTRGIRSFL